MIAWGLFRPSLKRLQSLAIKHTVETLGSTVKRRPRRSARFATDSEVRRTD